MILSEFFSFASLNSSATAVAFVADEPNLYKRFCSFTHSPKPLFHMFERSSIGDIKNDQSSNCSSILTKY